MNEFLTILPARARQVVYALFALAGAAGIAATAYYTATTGDVPAWVIGGMAALGALGILPNTLAATKVQPDAPGVDAYVVQADPDCEPKVLS